MERLPSIQGDSNKRDSIVQGNAKPALEKKSEAAKRRESTRLESNIRSHRGSVQREPPTGVKLDTPASVKLDGKMQLESSAVVSHSKMARTQQISLDQFPVKKT